MPELTHQGLTGDIIGAYYAVYNRTPRTHPEYIYERAMMGELCLPSPKRKRSLPPPIGSTPTWPTRLWADCMRFILFWGQVSSIAFTPMPAALNWGCVAWRSNRANECR
jgi:hypothetical protein